MCVCVCVCVCVRARILNTNDFLTVLFALKMRLTDTTTLSRNDLVGWLGFMAYQPLQVLSRQIDFYENSSISNNSV